MPTASIVNYTINRVDPVINPDDAMESMVHVKLKASTTFVAGTVLEDGGAGVYQPYSAGTARGILQYGVVTDASGFGSGDEWANRTDRTFPMYTEGTFRVADLTGPTLGVVDTGAVSDLGGHIITGVTSPDLDLFAF